MDKIKQIFAGNAGNAVDDSDDEELFADAEDHELLIKDSNSMYCTVTAPRPGVKGMVYIHAPAGQPAPKRARKSSFNNTIHKSTFSAIVKELVGPDLNVRAEAMLTLHEEAERYLQEVFEKAGILCQLRGCKTVGPSDLRGVQALAAPCFVEKKAILARDPAFGAVEAEAEVDDNKENVELAMPAMLAMPVDDDNKENVEPAEPAMP